MRSGEFIQSGFTAAVQEHEQDWLRRRLAFVPRPLRFLGVGSLGLITDLAIFTAIPVHARAPADREACLAGLRDAGDVAP